MMRPNLAALILGALLCHAVAGDETSLVQQTVYKSMQQASMPEAMPEAAFPEILDTAQRKGIFSLDYEKRAQGFELKIKYDDAQNITKERGNSSYITELFANITNQMVLAFNDEVALQNLSRLSSQIIENSKAWNQSMKEMTADLLAESDSYGVRKLKSKELKKLREDLRGLLEWYTNATWQIDGTLNELLGTACYLDELCYMQLNNGVDEGRMKMYVVLRSLYASARAPEIEMNNRYKDMLSKESDLLTFCMTSNNWWHEHFKTSCKRTEPNCMDDIPKSIDNTLDMIPSLLSTRSKHPLVHQPSASPIAHLAAKAYMDGHHFWAESIPVFHKLKRVNARVCQDLCSGMKPENAKDQCNAWTYSD